MSHDRKSPLIGQMMSDPLLISGIIQHADRHFGGNEIVSREADGSLHRYNYRDCHRRARQMAHVIKHLQVEMGDRVATLAWNDFRHLELYYAVSGSGAVVHTINPRLHVDQIAYIVNHAEDKCLFFDPAFLPLVEAVVDRCPTVKAFIALSSRERMPVSTVIPDLLCYEELISSASDAYRWPVFDENAASGLCYTSGTTGNPKGVLYSHRSTVLHSYASAMRDGLDVSAREVVMPVVPMFHVNAWGLPYSALMTGAKLVLPGAGLDGKSLYDLFESEGVTFSAGVPTIWLGLLGYVEQNKLRFSTFKRLPSEAQDAILQKQGNAIFGVDLKIVDDHGQELPWDGKTYGNLLVKGSWIVESYFKNEGGSILDNGWFPTGDVATITHDGYMQITDRSKDVIKSGGEWIGTVELENIAMDHPAVQQAACIGVAHPKWDERPLLLVVKRPGAAVSKDELIGFYAGKVAKWWVPDDVCFVESLPIGATGKVLKNRLREQFKDFRSSAT